MVATPKFDGRGWSSRRHSSLPRWGPQSGCQYLAVPTLAGESGGGAFVIVYHRLRVPARPAAGIVGDLHRTRGPDRRDRRSAAWRRRSRRWSSPRMVGVRCGRALAAFLIVAFYSVVAGWVLYYVGVMGRISRRTIMAGDPFRGALAGESRDADPAAAGRHVRQSAAAPAVHFLFMRADALRRCARRRRASRRPPPISCRCSSSCLSGW